MSEREYLLNKISEQQFAMFETALFLDTHPNDQRALEAFEIYRQSAQDLKAEYEEKFGMLLLSHKNKGNSWNWVRNPWPWD